jgi:ATP-dependent helicase HrpA
LYKSGKKFINTTLGIGKEYQTCFDLIQKLSLQHQKKRKTFTILSDLFKNLKDLAPHNFLDIYTYERVIHLNRYISCITIRAQRAADNPVKEEKKILQLAKYNRYLENLLSSLSQKSTLEKSQLIEEFFWLLEEYKISLFAPEIKTAVKISAKRLDKFVSRLSTMI